jgi:predicted RNA polymerase sigma factor
LGKSWKRKGWPANGAEAQAALKHHCQGVNRFATLQREPEPRGELARTHNGFQGGRAPLGRARELGGAGGAYALQAAIVACHAQARTAADTDWSRIARLYTELAAIVRSPIIDLNRAVAVGMAEGPEAALAIVDCLAHEPALRSYHLLPSVRGDLLHRLGRYEEACAAFGAAAALAGNRREHDLLRRRAAEAAAAAMSS